MANIIAWKSEIEVFVEGIAESFTVEVKRLSMGKRQELQALLQKLEKLDPKKKTPKAIEKKFEELFQDMVTGISGITFEWAEGEKSEPSNLTELQEAFAKYEPNSVGSRMQELFWLVVQEQFLSAHQKKLSSIGVDGVKRQMNSDQDKNGTTTQTA